VTKTSPQICSAIKFRGDDNKIYWRIRTADGGTRYVSFYWGMLPTERVEKFLKWINDPTINNRKKICRMVALPKLPKEKLRDSDFLKNEIFERLELRQRQGKFFNKPSQLTREQKIKFDALMNEAMAKGDKGIADIKAAAKHWINAANGFRSFGKNWETATGHRRFFMRDYVKLKPLIPEHITSEHCRQALSAWRNNPQWITDIGLAIFICRRMGFIK
jgi:hypothetical protein